MKVYTVSFSRNGDFDGLCSGLGHGSQHQIKMEDAAWAAINALELKGRHRYSWPDGSLYINILFDGTTNALKADLNNKLVELEEKSDSELRVRAREVFAMKYDEFARIPEEWLSEIEDLPEGWQKE